MKKIYLCAITLAVSACSPGTPTQPAAPAAEVAPVDPETKIPEWVREPYDPSQFPKLAKKLGPAFARIDATRAAAALHAARSEKCDMVEVAEVSDARSTPENITIFVDCSNRERFYVSESDLANTQAQGPVAQSDLTVSRPDAIGACAAAARAETMYPSLADVHVWSGASFSANQTTGNARVLLDFEATNALGVELPYQADCLFPAGGGPGELTIRPR